MTIDDFRLPPILEPEHSKVAIDALRRYFTVGADGTPSFSGSRFERFAGGGDRAGITNQFTSDDLAAVTLLSVNVPGQAALRILDDSDYRAGLSELLRQIPTDFELVDASDEVLETAEELWRRIRQNHTVGRTRTSKLLARKRPHLLPVIDSVVTEAGDVGSRNVRQRRSRTMAVTSDSNAWGHVCANARPARPMGCSSPTPAPRSSAAIESNACPGFALRHRPPRTFPRTPGA